MELLDLLEEFTSMKVVFKFVETTFGAQYATTLGVFLMLM